MLRIYCEAYSIEKNSILDWSVESASKRWNEYCTEKKSHLLICWIECHGRIFDIIRTYFFIYCFEIFWKLVAFWRLQSQSSVVGQGYDAVTKPVRVLIVVLTALIWCATLFRFYSIPKNILDLSAGIHRPFLVFNQNIFSIGTPVDIAIFTILIGDCFYFLGLNESIYYTTETAAVMLMMTWNGTVTWNYMKKSFKMIWKTSTYVQ